MKKSRDQLATAIILVFVLMGISSLVSNNTTETYQADNTAGIEIFVENGNGMSPASAKEL